MPSHPVGAYPHPQVNGMTLGLLDPFPGVVWNVCKQFVPVDPEEPILHGFGDAEIE